MEQANWPCYVTHPRHSGLLDNIGEAAGLTIETAERTAGVTEGTTLWFSHKPFTQAVARYFTRDADDRARIAQANLNECDIVVCHHNGEIRIIHVDDFDL
jgi:hypothetical protein